MKLSNNIIDETEKREQQRRQEQNREIVCSVCGYTSGGEEVWTEMCTRFTFLVGGPVWTELTNQRPA